MRQAYEDLRQAFMKTDDDTLLAEIASIAPPADEGEIISLMFIVALHLKRHGFPRDGHRRDLLAGAVEQVRKAVESRAALH